VQRHGTWWTIGLAFAVAIAGLYPVLFTPQAAVITLVVAFVALFGREIVATYRANRAAMRWRSEQLPLARVHRLGSADQNGSAASTSIRANWPL